MDALLADTTPAQFNEWLALSNLEPWGDDWVQAARLEAAIYNSPGRDEPLNPADLVPTRENMAKHDETNDAVLAAKWRARLGG